MSTHIRTRLHYIFTDEQLLHYALRSAHRGKDDDFLDDGNRGLAHFGNLAIQMAMTHDAIIDKRKTLHDIHTQDHWSKTKKGRAKACRMLGLEALILQSVRQQHQPPSDTVLDHALSAVLGAIWLDCERQEHKMSDIRSIILEVLRTIDAIVGEQLVTARHVIGVGEKATDRCNLSIDPPERRFEPSDLNHGSVDDVERFIRDWFEREIGQFTHEMLPHQADPAALELFAGQEDSLAFLEDYHVSDISATDLVSDNNHFAFGSDVEPYNDGSSYEIQENHTSDEQMEQPLLQTSPSNAGSTLKGSKRKRNQDIGEKHRSLYREMLQTEKQKLTHVSQVDQGSLIRFLQHPVLEKQEGRASILIRFLYLAIGSWKTVVAFNDLLQLARSDKSVCRQACLLSRDVAAMYGEICRLEKEEALCVLLRRYYIMNLCDGEQLYNDRHSHVIVETPLTIGGVRVAKPGNPVFARDSSLTETLLLKIMPDIDPESKEFKNARSKVKRLRKLAERLRLLVKRYGFGILGLLPSGSSFGQISLTDDMLLSISQANFHDFGQLLHREQGLYLEKLSKFIEPSLLAIVAGSSEIDTMNLVEGVDVLLLGELPKGSIWRGLSQELHT